MFFVSGTTSTLSGIGEDVVTRWPWWLGSGGLGVVLGWWGGGGPWLGGLGGCHWWWLCCSFYVAVLRARGAPPPLGEGAFLFFVIQFGVAVWLSV